MTDSGQLNRIAEELFWWQAPEVSLADPRRFLAKVMSLGTWEHVQAAKRVFGLERFRDALLNAQAGWFDPRSWALWHRAFGLPIAPMPTRSLK